MTKWGEKQGWRSEWERQTQQLVSSDADSQLPGAWLFGPLGQRCWIDEPCLPWPCMWGVPMHTLSPACAVLSCHFWDVEPMERERDLPKVTRLCQHLLGSRMTSEPNGALPLLVRVSSVWNEQLS